jgi:hypothetical protein
VSAVEARAATDLGWYVYGVVDAGASAPAEGGVEADVTVVPEGPLAALVSRVPLTVYGEEPVRARLEDPVWLEEKARAHEAVLEGALRAGPVVPFRFLTLYRDEDELRAFLAARGAELRDVLERVRGKVELGVKVFADRARLASGLAQEIDAVRELDAAIESAAPGKAYLLRRQREELAKEHAASVLRDCARASHTRLSAAAEAAVSNPPQPRELSGREEQMLLNGAYLVPAGDDGVAAVAAELEDEYRHLGVTFELTGPWPPYNFVPPGLSADEGRR